MRLVKVRNSIVTAEYNIDHEPEPGLIDITAIYDGQIYEGRTLLPDGTFTAFVPPVPTPEEAARGRLKAQNPTTASLKDIFEAQQFLL